MAEASDKKGMLLQNLEDAGCNQEMIQKCMIYVQQQQKEKLLQTLNFYRRTLLDTVHVCHKKMDCLDYLIYQLEKQI